MGKIKLKTRNPLTDNPNFTYNALLANTSEIKKWDFRKTI
jgi:hypothetical protein